MNIIFDLDGTLIDSKQRLHQLFLHLAPRCALTYEQYWERKKNKITNEDILKQEYGYPEEAVDAFVADWMQRIEAPEYLNLDTNFEGMHETLDRLNKQHRLYVCTARQKRAPVMHQLERLQLLPHFHAVLVTEHKSSKKDLVRAQVPDLSGNDWAIGDTGEDILFGKALNIRTCGVLTGFRSRQTLLSYEPDMILNAAVEFDPT